MSTRALVIAFGLLFIFILWAVAIVGGTYLADNPDTLASIQAKLQPPPTAAEIEEFDQIKFEEAQRRIDDKLALARLETIANGKRTEWIQSEMEDRVAFCLDEVAKHFPGRSIQKLTAITILLMKGMNQNRLGDNPMTSHEMARHILSTQGEEMEIEANRVIEGL